MVIRLTLRYVTWWGCSRGRSALPDECSCFRRFDTSRRVETKSLRWPCVWYAQLLWRRKWRRKSGRLAVAWLTTSVAESRLPAKPETQWKLSTRQSRLNYYPSEKQRATSDMSTVKPVKFINLCNLFLLGDCSLVATRKVRTTEREVTENWTRTAISKQSAACINVEGAAIV